MPATDWIHVPLFGEVVPSCRPYMALELMHTPELAKTLANRRPVPAAHLPPLEPVAPNGQALIKHPLWAPVEGTTPAAKCVHIGNGGR